MAAASSANTPAHRKFDGINRSATVERGGNAGVSPGGAAPFNPGGWDMKIKRHGSAVWRGGFKDGEGAISTESGALKNYPYGFASRFAGQRGSNPEELIAAAHASCFTMALSLILGEAKFTAEQMDTTAEVVLEQVEGGYAITAVQLTLKAKIPGIDQPTFEKLTGMAKAGCPVSKLLKAEIALDATLLG
jgi:lipoyl-dependent peroxiredoxin